MTTTDWIEVGPPENFRVVTGRTISESPAQVLTLDRMDDVWDLLQLNRSDAALRLASRDLYRAEQFSEERIVFLYRAVETIKKRFGGWDIMERNLKLAKNFTRPLRRIANELTGARHPRNTLELPSATSDQIIDCRFIAVTVCGKYLAYMRKQGQHLKTS